MHAHDVTLNIPSQWDLLEEVRCAVRQRVGHLPRDLRDAAVMTASELTENAVKYGQRTSHCGMATFHFLLTEARLQLTVRSGLSDPTHVRALEDRIAEINAASNKQALYIRRLEMLIEQQRDTGTAGLGLYKIAAESSFTLSCTYVNHVLTMEASHLLEA